MMTEAKIKTLEEIAVERHNEEFVAASTWIFDKYGTPPDDDSSRDDYYSEYNRHDFICDMADFALNRQSELEAEVAVLREARLRLFGILGGAESITFDQDRFGYTQDEFGWRHSLDILEDGVEMYDRAEKDVELLNLLSTMPDDIANALTKADGGDDDGK